MEGKHEKGTEKSWSRAERSRAEESRAGHRAGAEQSRSRAEQEQGREGAGQSRAGQSRNRAEQEQEQSRAGTGQSRSRAEQSRSRSRSRVEQRRAGAGAEQYRSQQVCTCKPGPTQTHTLIFSPARDRSYARKVLISFSYVTTSIPEIHGHIYHAGGRQLSLIPTSGLSGSIMFPDILQCLVSVPST